MKVKSENTQEEVLTLDEISFRLDSRLAGP